MISCGGVFLFSEGNNGWSVVLLKGENGRIWNPPLRVLRWSHSKNGRPMLAFAKVIFYYFVGRGLAPPVLMIYIWGAGANHHPTGFMLAG